MVVPVASVDEEEEVSLPRQKISDRRGTILFKLNISTETGRMTKLAETFLDTCIQ